MMTPSPRIRVFSFLALGLAALATGLALPPQPAGAETFKIGVADLAYAVYTHPRMRYFDPVSQRFLKAEMLASAIEVKERSLFRREKLSSMKERQKTLVDNENLLREISRLDEDKDLLIAAINDITTKVARRVESETRGLGQRDPERERAARMAMGDLGAGLPGLEKKLAALLDRRRRLQEEADDLSIARASSEVYSDPAESLKAVRTVSSDLRRALERVKARLDLSTVVNGSFLTRESYFAGEGSAAAEKPVIGSAGQGDSEGVSSGSAVDGGPSATDEPAATIEFAAACRRVLENDGVFRLVAGESLVPYTRKNLLYSEITAELVAELMEVCKAPVDYAASMKRVSAALAEKISPEVFDFDKRRGN